MYRDSLEQQGQEIMPEGKDTQTKNESRQNRSLSTPAAAAVTVTPEAMFESAVESIEMDFSEATLQRHAALLNDSRFSHPANAAQKRMLVSRLQRDYGNTYVRRLMYPAAHPKASAEYSPLADSPLVHAAQEEDRRGDEYQADPKTSDRIERLQGSGRALDSEVRQEMETTFGQDLGGVRIHTGSEADQLNHTVHAEAFTTDKDIFFRNGNYTPESQQGKELLAHELTHVIQHTRGQTETQTESRESSGSGMPGQGLEQPDMEDTPGVGLNTQSGSDISTLQRIPVSDLPHSAHIPESNQELIDAAIKSEDVGDIKAIKDFKGVHKDTKEKWISILANQKGWVGPRDEWALEKLWNSFASQEEFEQVARDNFGLWNKCIEVGAELDDIPAVQRVRKKFELDVKSVALDYLNKNRAHALEELARFGLSEDIAPTKEMTDQQKAAMVQLQTSAGRVKEIQEGMAALRQIPVGYNTEIIEIEGRIFPIESRASFDPDNKPQKPPHGTEDPEWPTWGDANQEHQNFMSVIGFLGNQFPSIYAALQQDRLDDLLFKQEGSEARAAIGEILRKALEGISETIPKIASGDLDYRDLQPIHSQLFGGNKAETGIEWNHPFYQWSAKGLLADHQTTEMLISLGLGFAGAAAFIAAGWATLPGWIFTTIGISAGAIQAGISWEQYLDLAAAADSEVSAELSLISQEQASMALAMALLDSAFVFVDVYSSITAALRAKTIMGEIQQAGMEKAAIEGLETLGRDPVRRSIYHLGVEETLSQTGKSADELLAIVGTDSPAGARIRAFKEALESGGTGASELTSQIRTLVKDLDAKTITRAAADKKLIQAIDFYGPKKTLEMAGGWNRLTAAFGDEPVPEFGKRLLRYRESLVADLATFVKSDLGGEMIRPGSTNLTSDVDISLMGPHATANREKAKIFMASRAGMDEQGLKRLLKIDFFTDPTRMHIYDFAKEVPDDLLKEIATNAAIFERELIWNHRLFEARKFGNGRAQQNILEQMAELNVREVRYTPLAKADVQKIGERIDVLHQRLLATKDPATQASLIKEIGENQALINASERGGYLSGGGVRTHVSENAGLIEKGDGILLDRQKLNDVLDQLYKLDDAAAKHLKASTEDLTEMHDALKSVGKYGDRLHTTVGKALGVKVPNGTEFNRLANKFKELIEDARATREGIERPKPNLREKLDADYRTVRENGRRMLKDLEDASTEILKALNEQAGISGVEKGRLAHIKFYRMAHAKLIRVTEKIYVDLTFAGRTITEGLSE